MSCIFCRIVAGEIPSSKLLETEHAFSFLDINPLARGHALVIPREHQPLYEELSGDARIGLAAATAQVAAALRAATGAPATSIFINNGAAAGQEVPHCHVHVVPREAGDGGRSLHHVFPGVGQPSSGELAALASEIVSAMRP